MLAAEFPNVRFEEVDATPYASAPSVNAKADNSAYLTLEAFRPTGRPRVVFIDSDIVVLRDFSDVLEIDHPFVACEAGGHPRAYQGPRLTKGMINTGFLVLGPPYTGGRTFEELLERVAANRSATLRDQAIINAHVPIDQVHVLPDTYNFRGFQHLAHFVDLAPDIRLLHFSGYHFRPKPWEPEARLDSLAYRIWAEAAVDAVEEAPALEPLIPDFQELRARLERVQVRSRSGVGILEVLRGDVVEDRRAEHQVFGDTTLNRLRGLTPGWLVRFARRLVGGSSGDAR